MTFLLLCGKWEVETERRLGYKLRNVYISTTAYKDYDSPRLPSLLSCLSCCTLSSVRQGLCGSPGAGHMVSTQCLFMNV